MEIAGKIPFSTTANHFICYIILQNQICKSQYLKKFPKFLVKISEFRNCYLFIRYFEYSKWNLENFFNYINILFKSRHKNLSLIIRLLYKYNNFYQTKYSRNIKKIKNLMSNNSLIFILGIVLPELSKSHFSYKLLFTINFIKKTKKKIISLISLILVYSKLKNRKLIKLLFALIFNSSREFPKFIIFFFLNFIIRNKLISNVYN